MLRFSYHNGNGREKITDNKKEVWCKPENGAGSALSGISPADFNTLFSKISLEKTSVMLKTYTAEKVFLDVQGSKKSSLTGSHFKLATVHQAQEVQQQC